MPTVESYDEWMRTGRLSPYVVERKSAGTGIKLFECAQPAGDMSDPATASMVLVHILSDGVQQRSDLGGGLRESTARTGALALCPPGFASRIEIFGPHRVRLFAFDEAQFREVLEEARPGRDPYDFGRLHQLPFMVPQLGRTLDRLWQDASDQGGGRLLAEASALEILGVLTREADRKSNVIRGGLAPWAERRVREYLHAYYREDISLDTLAAMVGLSKFHFSRMFKQSMGVPPYVYQRRVRVERAQHLLANTSLPVIEIGAEVGYETHQAFARMFRAEVGSSPTEWRRAFRFQ